MSPEYPDLLFVPPAAYGKGRPWANTPRVIVVHYTAGSERSTSAEDGAAYDARRTDGTSCHYFVDSNSVVQCVKTTDRANSAMYNGNRIGIQYELCGTQQTRAQWLDAASDATLTNAARQIARDCAKWNIPVRKLTAAQVAAGMPGICGHADITLAFPSDGGDHMDPGTAFPWDVLISRIQQHTAPTITTVAVTDIEAATEEDDMAGGIPPQQIPATGPGSFTIWPVNTGAAGHGPAWINVGNDTNGVRYGVRVWGSKGDKAWFPVGNGTDGIVLLDSGQTWGTALPDGTRILSVSRTSVASGAQPYGGLLTFAVEYARRAA